MFMLCVFFIAFYRSYLSALALGLSSGMTNVCLWICFGFSADIPPDLLHPKPNYYQAFSTTDPYLPRPSPKKVPPKTNRADEIVDVVPGLSFS